MAHGVRQRVDEAARADALPLASPLAGSARAAYLHVPFCAHRCGYCNFTLVSGRDDLIEQYLAAIEIELSWLGSPRPVDTLFFGGGTPTYLSPDELRRLLATARCWFPLNLGYEFSAEANPIDLSAEKVAVLAEGGVTRVSLGAQSFNERKLATLERNHSGDTIRAAVRLLRDARIDVSLDLIFGVPGEDAAVWQSDLNQALALEPDHVSTYGLTFERGTQFWNRRQRGELPSLAEKIERDFYAAAIDRLTAAGYEHYEVSNFARPGHRCRHNETYWAGEPFFAAGPGAARYLDGRREMNHRSTTTYLRRVLAGQSPVAESETLSAEDRARELLVFGLRRMAGVGRGWFQNRTGQSIDRLAGPRVQEYCRLGLMADDGETIRLTRAGLFISDALWPKLLTGE